MKRPKTAKWRDVKRAFRHFGVGAQEGKAPGHGRPRHAMLADSEGNKFPIPARRDSDDIYRSYIEAARRRFRLTPEDGISDEEFYAAL